MRRLVLYALIAIAPTAMLSALPEHAWIDRAAAQTTENAGPADGQLTPEALQQLVGPIALYPDDLLSVVLPASTQPLQIVEAQRFLERHKTEPSLKPPSDWDPSVVALLNYPDVLSMMNHDLDWTQQLGNAVVAQQAAVLDAIQAFRKKAYDAGNLKSNDKQSVKVENQAVIVQSADPQTIYVPQYDPQVVVAPIAVGAPAPYIYSPPYPYYASPAATFATGAVFGAAVGFAIGWTSHGIYTGNWGWGGYYGGGGSVNVNRVNNVNVNNARLTDAQRTQFNSQVTQNRENAWHPDRTATARQQTSLGTRGQAAPVTSAEIRSGLANRSGAGGGQAPQTRQNLSPQARQNIQSGLGQRSGGQPTRQPGSGVANRAPGSVAGNRPSFNGGQRPSPQGGRVASQQPGGAFGGVQNGRAANSFSNRGTTSLRSSNGFNGGERSRAGGGGFRGGGGGHGRR